MTVRQIDAVLPQTQCRQCGFDGCLPYAEAIHAGTAEINRCPPGGQAGVAVLAALTGRVEVPLDPACGSERPFQVAGIDEPECIGCTLCIQACPVDAIIGASKKMHVVLADLCTGCELCIAPCPVDCIAMVIPEGRRAWTRTDADGARIRHQRRKVRLARLTASACGAAPKARGPASSDCEGDSTVPAAETGSASATATSSPQASAARRAVIQAAIARARAKRAR